MSQKEGLTGMVGIRDQLSLYLNVAGRPRNRRTLVAVVLVICFCVLALTLSNLQRYDRLPAIRYDKLSHLFDHATNPEEYKGPIAVATFLADQWDGNDNDNDNDDVYFVGARMLAYQLLHSPQTRLSNPAPFVVLVTPEVRESKRQRLIKDGAIVVEVTRIEHNITITEPRWVDTFTKLRLFDPSAVPYRKVLYVDTDIVFTRPIDMIFRDTNTTPVNPMNHTSQIRDDEGPLPDSFIMSATPETREFDHPYPYLDPDHKKWYFNSGFLVYSPSQRLFDHYIRIHQHPERYYNKFPDQDLLNYAHRWGGPMPWKRLHFSWNINWPNDNDIHGGMAALHVKWWDPGYFARDVRDYALARRWEMEGYWEGRDSGYSYHDP